MLADDSMRNELYGWVKRKLNVSALTSASASESVRPPFEATSGGSSSTSAIEPVSRCSRSGTSTAIATSSRNSEAAPASAPRQAASSSSSGRRRRIDGDEAGARSSRRSQLRERDVEPQHVDAAACRGSRACGPARGRARAARRCAGASPRARATRCTWISAPGREMSGSRPEAEVGDEVDRHLCGGHAVLLRGRARGAPSPAVASSAAVRPEVRAAGAARVVGRRPRRGHGTTARPSSPGRAARSRRRGRRRARSEPLARSEKPAWPIAHTTTRVGDAADRA